MAKVITLPLKASSKHFASHLGLMHASLNEWGEYWEEEEKWDIVIYKENIYLVIQMAKTWNFLNVESDKGVFFFFLFNLAVFVTTFKGVSCYVNKVIFKSSMGAGCLEN